MIIVAYDLMLSYSVDKFVYVNFIRILIKHNYVNHAFPVLFVIHFYIEKNYMFKNEIIWIANMWYDIYLDW